MRRLHAFALVLALAPAARAQPSERAPIDLDGSIYRAALASGRRAAGRGRCVEALADLERAARSRHDDGRARSERVRCLRLLGRDFEELEEAAFERGGRATDRWRAAIHYELGLDAAARGEAEDAMERFLESLHAHPSETVRARAAALDRRERAEGRRPLGLRGASAFVLDEVEACEAPSCSVVREVRDAGVTYRVVDRLTMPAETIDLDGTTYQVSDDETTRELHVGRGGRWWRTEIGMAGGVGLAGTAYATEVSAFELVSAVPGGPREIRLETRSRSVDYDWCDSYWSEDRATYVCGMDGERAVCWARLATANEQWGGLGRVGFAQEPGAAAECGYEGSLRTAEERAEARGDVEIRARFEVRIRDHRMRVRGAAPPALRALRDVREVPCLLGAEGFGCGEE